MQGESASYFAACEGEPGRRIGHEPLRVFDVLAKFVGGDGVNAAAKRLKAGKRWRQGGGVLGAADAGDLMYLGGWEVVKG